MAPRCARGRCLIVAGLVATITLGAATTNGTGPAQDRSAHPDTTRATLLVATRPAAQPAEASPEKATVSPVAPYANPTPYYEVSPTGVVWPLGGATSYGSLSTASLHTTVVSVTVTPDGGGYWLLTAAGGVYNFGDAHWYGSPRRLAAGMVPEGLVAKSDGGGYWVYGRTGVVAAFGDAPALGSAGRPIVDLVATPDSAGYWVVDSKGVVSAFGTAVSSGDERASRLPHPVVGMAATPDGAGYWLVTSGGNVFNKGDAPFEGSLVRHAIAQPITSVLPTPDGGGYWLVTHDGDIHPYGDAAASQPPVTAFVHTVLTAGDVATEWAMAQLGKPYRWGGVGPAAFDCSGLTMESWLAAGVPIPRVADSQYIRNPHVALTDLVDGDLVFYASGKKPTSIYHVGLYLGGGYMVDAPRTGEVVQSAPIASTQLEAEGAAP